MSVSREFSSVAALTTWLEDIRWDCGSPDAFATCLSNYFNQGNEITVNGEPYDYQACIELC